MAREIEMTFKYDDGKEAKMVAKASAYPAPRIHPPVYYIRVDSFSEKSGTVKFGEFEINSATFQLLDGDDENEKQVFNIEPSNCSFEKNHDDNITFLKIFTQKVGTHLPFF